MRAALEPVGGRLVIADNASSDDSTQIVRDEAPWAELVECGGNRGYAGAFNCAIDKVGADGPALIVNPDCRPRPDAVAVLLHALEDPTVGVVVPKFLEGDGTLNHSLRRHPTFLRQAAEATLGQRFTARSSALSEIIHDPSEYDRDADVVWGTGAFVAMSGDCLQRVGRWAEHLFLYVEETDYQLRVIDAGLRVRYVAAAEVVHEGGELHSNHRLYSLLVRNIVELERMRHGAARAQALRGVLLVGALLRVIPNGRLALAAIRSLLGSQQAAVCRAGGSAVAGPGPATRAPRPGW